MMYFKPCELYRLLSAGVVYPAPGKTGELYEAIRQLSLTPMESSFDFVRMRGRIYYSLDRACRTDFIDRLLVANTFDTDSRPFLDYDRIVRYLDEGIIQPNFGNVASFKVIARACCDYPDLGKACRVLAENCTSFKTHAMRTKPTTFTLTEQIAYLFRTQCTTLL